MKRLAPPGRWLLALAVCIPVAHPAKAQSWLGAYYQNVPLWSGSSALAAGGTSDFNRMRFTATPGFGALTLDVAYEHVLTLRETGSSGLFVGAVPSGGEWLPLQWTLEESEHVLWQHRFDRLSVGWSPSSSLALDLGRQTISWATTLFLSPADPFSPFDPADPFRVFRAGVDAARVRLYPGPLSEIDVVVRPTETAVGEELTALGRGLTVLSGWELSGWGGVLYDELAGAAGAAGSLGSWALRGEAVVREAGDEVAVRASVGLDRLFALAGRDLYLSAEIQHDGFGAAGAADYEELLASHPFQRGELQVLGRNETVFQVSWQVHPLVGVSGLGLWNIGDGSALVAPAFTYSASDSATVSGGVFLGFGESAASDELPLPSEYGATPTTVYLSLSLFF